VYYEFLPQGQLNTPLSLLSLLLLHWRLTASAWRHVAERHGKVEYEESVSPPWQHVCSLLCPCTNFWLQTKWLSFHTLITSGDFLLFPQLKMALNGRRFNDTNRVQAKLWDALRATLRTAARSLGSRNKVLGRLLSRGQHWLKASAAVT
jgi:hypothetical protein